MKQDFLIGKRFGSLIVLSESHRDNGVYWNCECDCGGNIKTKTSRLKEGHATSCGCLLTKNRQEFKEKNFKHGKGDHKLLTVWMDIRRRCNNPERFDYYLYGGRGIKICERWNKSFSNFLKDMGECPPGLTIERINTNKGYYKDNCKWATRAEQNRNSRKSKRWYIKGLVFDSSQLAADNFGVCHTTIQNWCKSKSKYDCWSVPLYKVFL